MTGYEEFQIIMAELKRKVNKPKNSDKDEAVEYLKSMFGI